MTSSSRRAVSTLYTRASCSLSATIAHRRNAVAPLRLTAIKLEPLTAAYSPVRRHRDDNEHCRPAKAAQTVSGWWRVDRLINFYCHALASSSATSATAATSPPPASKATRRQFVAQASLASSAPVVHPLHRSRPSRSSRVRYANTPIFSHRYTRT